MSETIPAALRAEVWRQSRGICYLCRRPIDPAGGFDVDHVIPRALHGPTVLGNLRATHAPCNRRKSDSLVCLPPGPAQRAVARVYAITGRLGDLHLSVTPLPIRWGPRVTTLRFILPPGAAHVTPALAAEVRADLRHADQTLGQAPAHDRASIGCSGGVMEVQLPRQRWTPVLAHDLPAPRGPEFVIGADMAGRPVWARIGNGSAPHWLVAGATDSGKSGALLTLALQAARTGARVACADVDGYGTFAPLDGSGALWCAPAEGAADATAVIRAVHAELEARAPGPEYQPLVLFVDELHMLGRPAMAQLQDIVLGGRKRRIHLVLASHYPRSDQVNRVTSQQVGHRLCLRVEDAVASRTIIERDGAEQLLGRGHGLYRHAGVVVPLQVALTTPEDCAALPRATSAPLALVAARTDRPTLVDHVAEAGKLVAAGQLEPSARAIRLRLGIGTDKARAVRDALVTV